MKKEAVLNSEKSVPFSLKARVRSFRYAWQGITTFFDTQHNAIIHLFTTIAAAGAAVYFNVSRNEAIAIVIIASVVWTTELLNTAIERLADMISTNYNPQVKLIKDVAAGAVLISALGALTTGLIIFIPKIFL